MLFNMAPANCLNNLQATKHTTKGCQRAPEVLTSSPITKLGLLQMLNMTIVKGSLL